MKRVMRSRVLFLCILGVLLLSGCSRGQKEVVNVLNWSSYIPDSVVRDFEKETGIQVNYSTYSSNEECLAKVSSAKEGTYDLIFPSDYMIEIMINRGMLETLDKSQLENVGNVDSFYFNQSFDSSNQYSLPFVMASTVIAVNRDHITDEITSYNDLLKEEYRNNITLIDDQRIIIGMALLANGYNMNTVNEEELAIAKDWLLRLKPNIKAFDSDSPKNFLITEEADIAVLWNAEAALAYQKNHNIEFIYPVEGSALSMDNFAIPKGARHKEAAYQFIDYILRGDVMKKIIESYPYKNVNSKTQLLLGSDYIYNIASNIPTSIIEHGVYVENIGEAVKLYDKLWAEIK